MIPERGRGRFGALLCALLLLAGAASAQTNLDPRLKGLLHRASSGGGFKPAGAETAAEPLPDRVSLFVRF